MSSKPAPKPDVQKSILRVLKTLITTMPAQMVFYGSALLAIAATNGAVLPGALGILATTVGVNVLSNILERVALGEDVPDDEIRKTVEEVIRITGIENLVTSNEFQRDIAHVFRQFDLVKYAVHKGEFTIVSILTDQFTQHRVMFEELQSELTVVREQMETLATREQSVEILKIIQEIAHRLEYSLRVFDTSHNARSGPLQLLNSEALNGPCLYSITPIESAFYNPRAWVSRKYKLTLWCEHSRLPLPVLNGGNSQKGVYEIEVFYEWFKKLAPYIKMLAYGLLFLILFAIVLIPLTMGDSEFKAIEQQLLAGGAIIGTISLIVIRISNIFLQRFDRIESQIESLTELVRTQRFATTMHAYGPELKAFHTFLRSKDPSFGGLVRVVNKRQEILWVHEQFASEYEIV